MNIEEVQRRLCRPFSLRRRKHGRLSPLSLQVVSLLAVTDSHYSICPCFVVTHQRWYMLRWVIFNDCSGYIASSYRDTTICCN